MCKKIEMFQCGNLFFSKLVTLSCLMKCIHCKIVSKNNDLVFVVVAFFQSNASKEQNSFRVFFSGVFVENDATPLTVIIVNEFNVLVSCIKCTIKIDRTVR